MSEIDPDEVRAASLQRWDRASSGWGNRAERLRSFGMPVSIWMISHLHLQPGERVLELAAGPGDTGFLAAELIQPGGVLVSSDWSEGMLNVARERARQIGVGNVEFARLDLEWIDLETASVDAILCRWGIMLALDPDAAAREMRRVLRPGGRAAFAVWDQPVHNPWATIPSRALVERSLVPPPDPDAPGMFALAAPGLLASLLEDAGFSDVVVDAVEVTRSYPRLNGYIEETLEVSPTFSDVYTQLPEDVRAAVLGDIEELSAPLKAADGSFTFPGRTLVAVASA